MLLATNLNCNEVIFHFLHKNDFRINAEEVVQHFKGHRFGVLRQLKDHLGFLGSLTFQCLPRWRVGILIVSLLRLLRRQLSTNGIQVNEGFLLTFNRGRGLDHAR